MRIICNIFYNWQDNFQKLTNVYPCEKLYNYYGHKWLFPTGDSMYFLSEPYWSSKFWVGIRRADHVKIACRRPRKQKSVILKRYSDVLNSTCRKTMFKLLSFSWWIYLRTARWRLRTYDLQDGKTRNSLTIRSVKSHPPRKSLSR